VKNCSPKYITFTDAFKLKALELDSKWVYHRKIFEDFGFPEYIYRSKIPKNSLCNWRHKLKNKWLSWLVQTKKWRKKKEKIDIALMSLEEQNEHLRIENAYLKELHKTVYWHYP
jgi:hypothetical protein